MRGSLDGGGSYGKGRMSRLSLKTLLGNGACRWAVNHLPAGVHPKWSRSELQLGGGNATLTERLHSCSPVGECYGRSPLLFQSGTLLPRVSGRHWRDKGDGNRAWVRVEAPQLSWASHLGGPGASTTQAPFGKFLSPSLLGCAMGPWVPPSLNFTVPLPAFTSQDPVSCFENFLLLLPGRSFGGAGRNGQVGQAEG